MYRLTDLGVQYPYPIRDHTPVPPPMARFGTKCHHWFYVTLLGDDIVLEDSNGGEVHFRSHAPEHAQRLFYSVITREWEHPPTEDDLSALKLRELPDLMPVLLATTQQERGHILRRAHFVNREHWPDLPCGFQKHMVESLLIQTWLWVDRSMTLEVRRSRFAWPPVSSHALPSVLTLAHTSGPETPIRSQITLSPDEAKIFTDRLITEPDITVTELILGS